MGVFRVPVTLKNWQNQFLPEDQRGEDIQCDARVDTGAVELALPVDLIERLKLRQTGEIPAHTADGSRHTFRVFGIVDLTVEGRSCQVRAIELPHDAEPLLGAVPLEEMDWHVSPQEKKLVPNAKSPDAPLIPLF